VKPLRTSLPDQGWETLSLQMPVLEKEASYYDYVPIFPEAHPRIDAAIAWLKARGIKRIVLIAHSCGAHMAMSWVTSGGTGIDAYVGIGMGATDYQQPMQGAFPLGQMTIPVLDIYGGNDYPAVLAMAPERLALMRKGGNPLSKQLAIPDADHYCVGQSDELVEIVAAWLNGLTFK
jgi:pimeloyl-ACP methyl ester carboxylesterase